MSHASLGMQQQLLCQYCDGQCASLTCICFRKIKRALALDHGKCQAFLYAWTHNRFTSFNSLSDHSMSAAEKRKTPIPFVTVNYKEEGSEESQTLRDSYCMKKHF